MAKILLVDDNDVFRSALKQTLEQGGYEVTVAENGKAAQERLGASGFTAVVSDIRMSPVNGIELLHHIKKTKPIPVILMTGFSELMETHEAASLGADGFLAKPFKSQELLDMLDGFLAPKDAPKPEPTEYCKISIDDFVSGHEIKFDIFIKVNDAKFLKIAHQGEDIPIDRIRAYKGKGLTHLYMRREDFRSYLGFGLMLARATKNKTVPTAKRLNLVKHTGELIMEKLHTTEITKEDFESARTVVETTVDLLSDNEDLFNMLSALNGHTDFLYAHSLGVSFYSTLIAKEMKWNAPANIYKISTGALLHDIGKKEIAREILEKPRISLSSDEIRQIETHTARGFELLSRVQSIPTDILQIVSQHHENCLGTGYPAHLKKNKIHPFARVVATANEFCNLTIKNPSCVPIPPREAVERMQSHYSGTLDQAFLDALCRVFKVGTAAGKKAA